MKIFLLWNSLLFGFWNSGEVVLFLARAFVDDSGSGGDSAYYVLGGYVGSAREWESFTVQWKEVLEMDPKLDYFKMSQAESLKGCFLGFSPTQRNQRIGRFCDVILAHDIYESSVAISYPDFCEVLKELLPVNMFSPYYFAFVAMVTSLSSYYRHRGAHMETIDFVFDKQQGKQARMNRLYESFRKAVPTWQLGKVDYHTDQQSLPLQAADLIAWHSRRFLCGRDPVREELKMLHADRSRWMRHTIRRKGIVKMAHAIVNNLPNLIAEVGYDKVQRALLDGRRHAKNKQKG